MSRHLNHSTPRTLELPALAPPEPARPLAWREGRQVRLADFAAEVHALARRLPDRRCVVNLCEDRYRFLVVFCAALQRRQTNLLPPSRAPQAIAEAMSAYPDSYRCDDSWFVAGGAPQESPALAAIGESHVAVIGFTSGSTGTPQQHAKTWGSFSASNALNTRLVETRLRGRGLQGTPSIVATVPPQHMYGMETSVLMPLLGGMAVHAARPLFPADIAAALAQIPEPRILVTTPVHLRSLLEASLPLPALALVLCATAPLDMALAQNAERTLETEVLELFGSTETCVIAHRRTAREQAWTPYPEIVLRPSADHTRVDAPWFAATTLLQDVVEVGPDGRFALRGRNADLVEIAGKRASLADLTRRVLAIPGVEDAVVFQSEAAGARGVCRIAALVVAPALDEAGIAAALRDAVDPAFLPRPLLRVPSLPRNEVGKLPRERLLQALRDHGAD